VSGLKPAEAATEHVELETATAMEEAEEAKQRAWQFKK